MHIASLTDINEACNVGNKAVEYALDGLSGIMVTILRTNNDPYTVEIDYVHIEKKVANKEKKASPRIGLMMILMM